MMKILTLLLAIAWIYIGSRYIIVKPVPDPIFVAILCFTLAIHNFTDLINPRK